MRKADVINGKCRAEMPYITQQHHHEWFIDARIFLCQEKSLKIQINVGHFSAKIILGLEIHI